jgi:hypothetical protein
VLLCAFSDSAPPLLAITCQTDLQFPADPVSISAGLMGPIGVLVTIGALRTTRRYASSRLIKIAGNRLCPIGTSIGPIFLKPNAS